MKKYLIFMFVLLFWNSQDMMRAQNTEQQNRKQANEEKIRQHQSNQMVHALSLDDATAAKFAPLYTQYLKEMMDCHKMKKNKDNQKISKKQELTDSEIETHIRNQFEVSKKMLDIRESYYDKFRKILTPKQILKIYQTERHNADKFKKTLKDRKSKGKLKNHQSQDDPNNL